MIKSQVYCFFDSVYIHQLNDDFPTETGLAPLTLTAAPPDAYV